MTITDVDKGPREPIPKSYEFPDALLPHRKETEAFMCGINPLSMVLEYWRRLGHMPPLVKEVDLTPESLLERFRKAITDNEFPSDKIEFANPQSITHLSVLRPRISGMAWLAENISQNSLRARTIGGDGWDKYTKGKPIDYLKAFVLGRKIPVIFRKSVHFCVVTGVNADSQQITYYDTDKDHTVVSSEDDFDKLWSSPAVDYKNNMHHMLLAIYPRSFDPQPKPPNHA